MFSYYNELYEIQAYKNLNLKYLTIYYDICNDVVLSRNHPFKNNKLYMFCAINDFITEKYSWFLTVHLAL